MNLEIKTAGFLFVLLCVSNSIATAQETHPGQALAKAVIQKSEIKAGICEMPRAGDGTLAAALALAGVAQVHALTPNFASAEKARKPAASLGVLGSQVVIEPFDAKTPTQLPLGDWVADLYVVADATDANLSELSAAEASRILSPYRGVAVVGNSSGSKAGLSKGALETWAKDTGGVVTVSEDTTGLWAVIKMPPLAGGDDWSHYYHAADGDPVSKDKAIVGSSYQLQYYDAPLNGERNYPVVVSAGRMFVATCILNVAGYNVAERPQKPYELEARSIYNAKLLWRRPISARFGEMGSLMVATPDRLYVKEGSDVLILNPETGTELNRIHATSDPLVVRWLTLSDGVLLTLAGTKPFSAKIDGAAQNGESGEDRVKRASSQSFQSETCQELVAWDTSTGKELWRFKDGSIDQKKLAVMNGRVFLYINDAYATALDLKSGHPIWKTDAPAPERKMLSGSLLETLQRGEMEAVAHPKAYVILDGFKHVFAAFDSADGHVLWNKSGKSIAGWPILLNETILGQDGGPIDLLTGEKSNDFVNPLTKQPISNVGGDSCGHTTAVDTGDSALWIGNGIFDVKTGKQLVPHLAKAGCGLGFFVADGTQILYPNTCNCAYFWKGMEVIRAAPAPRQWTGTRLEHGDSVEVAPTGPSDALDWPTYRGNETRKGSSAAVISAKAGLSWIYTPPLPPAGQGAAAPPAFMQNEKTATQPIAVGSKIWFGTVEGAVVCLDAKSGSEQWRYWTAGKIKSAPTWFDGRLYVGSSDGWVYCLDAEKGSLCWRSRVVPNEWRIDVMGGLSSAWPVWSNVLVHDGAAYAVAGMRGKLNGTALCALDAKTGELRWDKMFQSNGETTANGLISEDVPSGGGQMAWYGGKLWWQAEEETGLMVIDPANGNARKVVDLVPRTDFFATAKGFMNESGQDIGILPGGWVALGGNKPVRGVHEVWATGPGALFLRSGPDGIAESDHTKGMPTDPTQLPHFLATPVDGSTRVSRQIPVWDEKEVVFPGDLDKNDRSPQITQDFAGIMNAEDDKRDWVAAAQNKPDYRGWLTSYMDNFNPVASAPATVHSLLPDDLIKSLHDKTLRLSGSMLLAANAIVVTASRDNATYIEAGLNDWHAMAFSRTDRTLLWDVQLPAEPGLNGISLTRNGDVMIPLTDGRIACVGNVTDEIPVVAVSPIETQPGLLARHYITDVLPDEYRSWSDVDLDIMTPAKVDVATILPIKDEAHNVIRLEGFLEVPETGIYRFTRSCSISGSDASFTLFDTTGRFVATQIDVFGENQSAPVKLEKGKHPISAIVMAGNAEENYNLQWEGPNLKRGDIPAEAWSHLPLPSSAPASGQAAASPSPGLVSSSAP